MNINSILKERRKELRLSVDALSMASGVPRSTITNYENGIQPTIGKLDKLLKALGLSITIGAAEQEAEHGAD